MATYAQIKALSERLGGSKIETCWIAEVKERLGLPVRKANNRLDPAARKKVCPAEKEGVIIQALKELKMI